MNIVQKSMNLFIHFTHQLNAKLPINIIKGDSVYLIIDENNTKYIDAISS
ncbi:MAG: hypothetical protein U0V03_11885 [Bacteroidia bacterium]